MRGAWISVIKLPTKSDIMDELGMIEKFQERAAIMEYDGGASRSEAEVAAYQELFAIVGPHAEIPESIREMYAQSLLSM